MGRHGKGKFLTPKRPKTTLDLPDLDHSKSAVLNTDGSCLLPLRRQMVSTALALLGQDRQNLVDSLGGGQGPMGSPVARLSAWLAPTFLAPTPLSGFTR